MIWLGHQARVRHQRGPVGRVPHFPAKRRQLVANLVGPREVLRRPRLLALQHQPIGAADRPRHPDPAAASDAEPDQLQHLRQDGRSDAPAPHPGSPPRTSSNTSAIALGVLKSSASALRGSRAAAESPGGLGGASPLLLRRVPSGSGPPSAPERSSAAARPAPPPAPSAPPRTPAAAGSARRSGRRPPPRARTCRAPPTAGRCCRPISTSSRRPSRSSRCASRSGRTGRPAASDWAISFSWWGKTRSEPPPWIAKEAPSSASAITEHSMCQAGPPRPPGRVPAGVLALLVGLPEGEVEAVLLERARTGLLALVHVLGAAVGELAVAVEAADAEVDVAAGLVGVAGLDQLGDQGDDAGDRRGRAAARRRGARARADRCPRSRRRSSRAANSPEGSPAAAAAV